MVRASKADWRNNQIKDAAEEFFTPPEIAKMLRVNNDKVLGWIRSGQLRAINISNGSRPRYCVSRRNLDRFLKIREVQPPPPRATRRKRQQPEGGPLDPALGKESAKKGEAREVFGVYYIVWEGMTLYF